MKYFRKICEVENLTSIAAIKWIIGTNTWSVFVPPAYPSKAMTMQKVWMIVKPSDIIAVDEKKHHKSNNAYEKISNTKTYSLHSTM